MSRGRVRHGRITGEAVERVVRWTLETKRRVMRANFHSAQTKGSAGRRRSAGWSRRSATWTPTSILALSRV
jgi:hypothetical protein